jgi:DNA repair exonuclease SbcCD ATPase subunit
MSIKEKPQWMDLPEVPEGTIPDLAEQIMQHETDSEVIATLRAALAERDAELEEWRKSSPSPADCERCANDTRDQLATLRAELAEAREKLQEEMRYTAQLTGQRNEAQAERDEARGEVERLRDEYRIAVRAGSKAIDEVERLRAVLRRTEEGESND